MFYKIKSLVLLTNQSCIVFSALMKVYVNCNYDQALKKNFNPE